MDWSIQVWGLAMEKLRELDWGLGQSRSVVGGSSGGRGLVTKYLGEREHD